MIDVAAGTLLLADGVTLGPHFNAAAFRASPLRRTVQPVSATAPFHTLVGTATLADGVPVGLTLVFADLVLAQVSFRFAYPGGVDEALVDAQHRQWLERTLGPGSDHVYPWGSVVATLHPRDAEAAITLTWRGVSHLHDSALPPVPAAIDGR